MPLTVYAATNDDWWCLQTDSMQIILEYTGSEATIEIPDTIDDRPVTHISQDFDESRNKEVITKIIISSGIAIPNTAFQNLSNLEEVNFKNTTGSSHIGEDVFPSGLKK